jgi:predicted glycosyl hydrolase (DUF1957 family)
VISLHGSFVLTYISNINEVREDLEHFSARSRHRTLRSISLRSTRHQDDPGKRSDSVYRFKQNGAGYALQIHSQQYEYRYRFDKQECHRSIDVLHSISSYRYTSRCLTPFAQAMPDKYKIPGDAVSAYRRFYIAEKQRFARWTRREKPEWFVSPETKAA